MDRLQASVWLVIATISTMACQEVSSQSALVDIVLRNLVNTSKLFVGSASNYHHLQQDKEYTEIMAQQFSITTPENGCKCTNLCIRTALRPSPNTFNFTECDFVVQTAEKNNQSIRGHNLCWGVHNPTWLSMFAGNKSALEDQLVKHISTVAARYNGRLYAWDVVNEAVLDNPKTGQVLKTNIWYPTVPNYIDQAFLLAAKMDKTAKLFYNDYNAEVINAKSDAIYSMVKGMLHRDVPIHGVGLQAHMQLMVNADGSQHLHSYKHNAMDAFHQASHLQDDNRTLDGKLFSPIPSDWSSVSNNIKRFVDLSLEVHITEMDVRVIGSASAEEKLKQQAIVYSKMLEACLEHAPNCRSYEVWGFVDKYTWKYSNEMPDLYDNNYKPKPCFYAVADKLNSTSIH